MLSMQFTSLLTESGKRKWGRVRVRVRVVNGKAREIRICFSHNCFNPFSYNKQGNWEET